MGRRKSQSGLMIKKAPKRIFSHIKVQELLSDPKLNLTAVAKEVGIGAAFLYNISEGLRPCTMKALEGLCHAFNKDPGWFFDEEANVAQKRLVMGRGVSNAS